MDEVDTAASTGKPPWLPTGIADLDEHCGCLGPGSLTVIGGFPGAGSSALALGFARNVSISHGADAAYLTLDSHPSDLVLRLLSAEAKVKLDGFRSGRMANDSPGECQNSTRRP